MTRRSRLLVGAALSGILVLAVALRRWGWENWSLWLDECLEFFVSSHSTREIIAMLRFERNHPPLDYLVMHTALKVSASALFLRWVPTLWSAVAALLVFLRSGGTKRPFASLGAAFAFGVLPFAVHQGQELRPYALALLFVALADVARTRHSVLYVLSCVLAVYTIYLSFLPLIFFWAVDLIEARQARGGARAVVKACAAPVVTLLAFLPWLWAVSSHLTRPNEIPARVSPRLLAELLVGFLARRDPGLERAWAAIVVLALAVVGVLAVERWERLLVGLELLWIVGAVSAFLELTNHWFEVRYFWFALWPLSRLLGEGIGATHRLARFRVPAWAASAALLLAVEAPALAENAESGRVDWRVPVRYVAWQEREGRAGPIVPADMWSYMLLYYQNEQWETPLKLESACETPGALQAGIDRIPQGWIGRVPWGGPGMDEFLERSAKPWARFDHADGLRLYRFEKGRLIPP